MLNNNIEKKVSQIKEAKFSTQQQCEIIHLKF